MGKPVRLQVELDEAKMNEIESWMDQGKVRTKKEFVEAALAFFYWALTERRAGRIIASVDEKRDVYKEIVTPILSAVKPAPEQREQVAYSRA